MTQAQHHLSDDDIIEVVIRSLESDDSIRQRVLKALFNPKVSDKEISSDKIWSILEKHWQKTDVPLKSTDKTDDEIAYDL